MELKQKKVTKKKLAESLLIVPYGIETGLMIKTPKDFQAF